MFNKFYISKANLINNLKAIKKKNKSALICAMVKANAYGIGAKQVVKIVDKKIDYYGVATLNEAKKLNKYTNKKILIVGPFELGGNNFSYTLSSLKDVRKAIKFGKKINVHLKVNSGMNRYGFNSLKKFYLALKFIKNSNINLEGIFTHYATADSLVNLQTKKFVKFVNLAHYMGFKPIIHADNSEVNRAFNHNFDMVRVGFGLYLNDSAPFKPVASIYSKIVQINHVHSGNLVGYNYRAVADRPMRVAVVPLGYADGLDMRLIGFNLRLNGAECKILNICMDCFMLDISHTKITKKDTVPILNKHNNLLKYANYLKTHVYEVSTKFGQIRAKRIIR